MIQNWLRITDLYWPDSGGVELGREYVDRPVAGGDGELAQHWEADQQPGLLPGDEDGDCEDQPGQYHTAGHGQTSPHPANNTEL